MSACATTSQWANIPGKSNRGLTSMDTLGASRRDAWHIIDCNLSGKMSWDETFQIRRHLFVTWNLEDA
jgi:hypothetical protein